MNEEQCSNVLSKKLYQPKLLRANYEIYIGSFHTYFLRLGDNLNLWWEGVKRKSLKGSFGIKFKIDCKEREFECYWLALSNATKKKQKGETVKPIASLPITWKELERLKSKDFYLNFQVFKRDSF